MCSVASGTGSGGSRRGAEEGDKPFLSPMHEIL